MESSLSSHSDYEDEAITSDFDVNTNLSQCSPQEPLVTADDVIKEIDDIMADSSYDSIYDVDNCAEDVGTGMELPPVPIVPGKWKREGELSKQSEVQDIPNPGSLKDGTPSFKSYIGSKNNRYNTPEAAAKNRTVGVWEAIHFFNAPANIDEGKIRDLFASAGAPEPESAIVLKSRSERSSTGMINMKSGADALGAIALVNHTAIESDGNKGHPKSKEEIDME
ncbi:hypothetical protein QYM36_014780 [Artemia franciscana]|uniref:Heterogeneous nuclear ribonucleoprotein L RRM domain-containing protein n=1 Tax=Artemia franciscana TaxID=6661 RepID=A0AA88HL40_ARTSF|nr:hypothetical protein QYM36_014780 [Artemia franciscana]